MFVLVSLQIHNQFGRYPSNSFIFDTYDIVYRQQKIDVTMNLLGPHHAGNFKRSSVILGNS
jgi:hypothetical protein